MATSLRLFALGGIAAVALTACGGNTSNGSSSASTSTASSETTTTASSTTAADTNSATASTAPTSPAATSTESTTTQPSSTTAGSTTSKTTDAQLAAALKATKLSVGTPTPVSSSLLGQAKKANGDMVARLFQQMQITPADCKTALVNASKLLTSDQSLGLSMATSEQVMLRGMGSTDAAANFMTTTRQAGETCKTYTMSMTTGGKKSSITDQMTITPISSSVVEDAISRTEKVQQASGTSTTQAALGRVGDVVIQVSSKDPKVTAAALKSDLEALGKSVKAQQ